MSVSLDHELGEPGDTQVVEEPRVVAREEILVPEAERERERGVRERKRDE